MSLKNIGLINELLLPMMKAKTLTVEKSEIEPSPIIREKLELSQKDKLVVRIKRDRLIPEGFRAFTINHLPFDLGRRISEDVLFKKPLVKIMEDDLRINFIEAFQTIEVSFADEETASHLDILPGNPTLYTERIMYAEKGKPVEMVTTIYKADSYKCCFSLKKVKRKSAFDWICQITK
jgi:GntR family transcriptional regulator